MIRPGTCIEEQCLTASVPMFLSNARNHSAIAWQPNKSQQVLAVLGYRVPQSLASANDALPSPEIETQRSLPLGTTRGGEKSEKTKDHHRSSQIITDPKNAMRALMFELHGIRDQGAAGLCSCQCSSRATRCWYTWQWHRMWLKIREKTVSEWKLTHPQPLPLVKKTTNSNNVFGGDKGTVQVWCYPKLWQDRNLARYVHIHR